MLNHLTLQPEFQTSSEIQVTYLRFCYPDPLVHGKRSAHAHPFTTPTSANAFDSERAKVMRRRSLESRCNRVKFLSVELAPYVARYSFEYNPNAVA